MKLLIIDITTEAQARCAKKIEAFSKSDMEMLDLKIRLASDKNYSSILQEADVAILGAELEEEAVNIARQINNLAPWLNVIMFVKDEFYKGDIFRETHSAGVRKVFSNNVSYLDFLQELVAINSEFKKEGRTRDGIIISVNHAKGGVGATSICAALSEVCGIYNKKTLLWDLDVETRDLSRSLVARGEEQQIVSSWVNGSQEVSRESIKTAIRPISNDVSILMPPDSMAESMDMVCHTDSIYLCSRILELSKVLFDVIIVDTGGRMGPATGSIVRNSDKVVIVIDDTVFGLTALDVYLNFIGNILNEKDERISFIINKYTGRYLKKKTIKNEINQVHGFTDNAWRSDPIEFDEKGAFWPASGKTLYGIGTRDTRCLLEKMIFDLGIQGEQKSLIKLSDADKMLKKHNNFMNKFFKS